MELQTLLEVQAEMQRFEKRLNDAIGKIKFEKDNYMGSKESGALKRGAMDLKAELLKITKA